MNDKFQEWLDSFKYWNDEVTISQVQRAYLASKEQLTAVEQVHNRAHTNFLVSERKRLKNGS